MTSSRDTSLTFTVEYYAGPIYQAHPAVHRQGVQIVARCPASWRRRRVFWDGRTPCFKLWEAPYHHRRGWSHVNQAMAQQAWARALEIVQLLIDGWAEPEQLRSFELDPPLFASDLEVPCMACGSRGCDGQCQR